MKLSRFFLFAALLLSLPALLSSSASCQSTLNGKRIQPSSLPASALSATGSPSSTTFLRGDWTWATPPGSALDHKVILNSGDTSPDVLDNKLGVSGVLTIGDTGGVRVIGMGAAAAGVSGYLLGSDWTTFNAKEAGLGNPSTSGYVLSSTAAGVRSWVPSTSGPAGPAGPTGPAGAAGTNGTNGTNGAAATITSGTATALAAGATPTVTNSGSSSAAVFNFGIPAGAAGANGATGPTGPTGAMGATGSTGPAGPNYPFKNSAGTLTSAPTSLTFGSGLTATASGNDVTVTAAAGSTSYTLPAATTSALGGVIVGSGLSINTSGLLTASTNLAVSPVSGYQSLLQIAPGYQVAPGNAAYVSAPLLTDRASGDATTGYKGTATAAAKPSTIAFQSSNSIASGIIAAWPVYEGSGTTVHDISGNALNLSFTGTSPTWGTGPNGTVLTFGGAGSLTVADNALLKPTTGFTFSIYVNATNPQGNSYSRIFRKDASGGGGGYLSVAGTSGSYIITTGTAYSGVPSGSTYEGAYHLYTWTLNTSTNLLSFYVDGNLISTTSGTGTISWDTSAQYLMGQSGDDVTGNLDLAYEWNRALSATEVSTLAANVYQLVGTSSGGNVITALLSPGSLGYLPISTIKFTRTWSQQLSELLEYSTNGTSWTAIPTGYTPPNNAGTATSVQTTVTLSTPIIPLYLRYSGKDSGTGAALLLTDFSVS